MIMFHECWLLGCEGVQKPQEKQVKRPTEPGDVFVIPGERFFAGRVQSSAAWHPP